MKKVKRKYRKYLKLMKSKQDPRSGFIEHHECDALLFSGLVGCVPEVDIRIEKAYDKKLGIWKRRPTYIGPCYDPNKPQNQKSFIQRLSNSAYEVLKYLKRNEKVDWNYIAQNIFLKENSTISRDMLIGLAWYAWHNKRLDIAENVIKYALDNWGFMGEGDITRTNIMPGLFATFCWISYRLGGPNRWWARWIPADLGNKDLKGFTAHLQVLHIMIRAEIVGKGYSKREKAVLEYHAQREPNNPLFLYSVGNSEKAAEILLREDLWPSDRLPKKSDRHVQWIPMRDEGRDWKPTFRVAQRDHVHSGADFVFCAWLILRDLNSGIFREGSGDPKTD